MERSSCTTQGLPSKPAPSEPYKTPRLSIDVGVIGPVSVAHGALLTISHYAPVH